MPMMENNIENYHKFHRITMSYTDAEKYIKVGWRIVSIRKVSLRGINKEYDECCLVWDKDDSPIEPSNL